jgi:hypothetical protein
LAVDAQLQAGIVFPRIKMEIILVGVIVRQVDVSVIEEAVGTEEVIGLIAGKRDSLGDENERAKIVYEEGRDKKDDEFLLEGESFESVPPLFDQARVLFEEGTKAGEFKAENGKNDKNGEKTEPRPQVRFGYVVLQKERGEEKGKNRHARQDGFPVAFRISRGECLRLYSRDDLRSCRQQNKESCPTQEKSCKRESLEAEPVVEDRVCTGLKDGI